MNLNQDFQFVSTMDSLAEHDLKNEVTIELSTFFDSVMSTVVDYFEEAKVE